MPFALCSLLIAGYLAADSLTVDYYSSDNIKRFADFLYDQEDFHRAAGEYQRYLFAGETLLLDTDPALFRIGQCFRKTDDYEKAIGYFQQVIDNNQELARAANYQVALCYFLMERFDESDAYLSQNFPDPAQYNMEKDIQHLHAMNSIQQKQWDQAFSILSNLSQRDETTVDLMKFAYAGQNLPHKDKMLAAVYSTVIPGLGKLYCNRRIDGIQSFFSCAILGWQAYDGFHNDGVFSMKGWIFGTIGGIFYLGNIYGSVVAAEIYNEEREEKLMSVVKLYINVYFD